MAAYLTCLWNWPRCSSDVVRQTGYTKDRQPEGLRVRERKPISCEEYWSDHLFLPSSSPSSIRQRGRLSDKDRGEERERKRVKETDKGMTAPQQCSLCPAHSSAPYSNGTGNRLIIYPHNLSSGVAPKYSIITTSAQAAVKHCSQQALKMLYLSIWNAHPSCSSSSLSITSY